MALTPYPALRDHPNLRLHATGKVREVYVILDQPQHLLFVATDRISAFDVVLANGIKQKGAILTLMSKFWFELFQSKLSDVRTHYVATGLPESVRNQISASDINELEHRCMVVKRLDILPIESICRGYISGSAWSSYKKDSTVNGIKLPAGLRESDRLSEILWTPSTKALDPSQHDENINAERAAEIIGRDYAAQVESLSRRIYSVANSHAAEKGIIIADTKFEFALDRSVEPPAVVLCDEVLTPDSSRFWATNKYEPGKAQPSLDKQGLRDWLVDSKLQGKADVHIADDVKSETESRYHEAFYLLTGRRFEDELSEV